MGPSFPLMFISQKVKHGRITIEFPSAASALLPAKPLLLLLLYQAESTDGTAAVRTVASIERSISALPSKVAAVPSATHPPLDRCMGRHMYM